MPNAQGSDEYLAAVHVEENSWDTSKYIYTGRYSSSMCAPHAKRRNKTKLTMTIMYLHSTSVGQVGRYADREPRIPATRQGEHDSLAFAFC